MNFITQWHPAFHSPYQGTNSQTPAADHGTSRVLTLYLGYSLTRNTEIFVDVESSGGHGLGDGLGIAGFPDLDIVRAGAISAKPYPARFLVRQVIPLSSKSVAAERGPLALATSVPERRIEIRFGKFSLPDFFDLNAVGSDSHLQFMNWTTDNNGAWDYAADTRGYTVGAILEYQDRRWGVRFAEAFMPKVANGPDLEFNLHRAHAENFEAEWRHGLLLHRRGAIRVLGYGNHANMGNYRQAVADFLSGQQSVPDITAHSAGLRSKYGAGVNAEQGLTNWLTLYGRFGWNDGQNESFAYTEADESVAFGAGASGNRWGRKLDRSGVTLVSNALSADHRRYLALGGKGFLLGDGGLTYRREWIVEGYYTIHLWRGIFAAFDLQQITNPGYNRDRGPVLVPSLRLHLDF
jgi:high affinity Mn2+ porin